MKVIDKNFAFIDGQNLYLGSSQAGWSVDLVKFRIYLADKYNISNAYYFLGFINSEYYELYSEIQKAGFILQFREHNTNMLGIKKGNVDTDIVFSIMKALLDEHDMGKVVLVSGDGDYKRLVDYLIGKNKLRKILFPSKRYSSLYKKLTVTYFDMLYSDFIRKKIEKKKKRT